MRSVVPEVVLVFMSTPCSCIHSSVDKLRMCGKAIPPLPPSSNEAPAACNCWSTGSGNCIVNKPWLRWEMGGRRAETPASRSFSAHSYNFDCNARSSATNVGFAPAASNPSAVSPSPFAKQISRRVCFLMVVHGSMPSVRASPNNNPLFTIAGKAFLTCFDVLAVKISTF